MPTILRIIAHLRRAFASQRNTTLAWFLIVILVGMLVIEYADRL